MNRFAKWWQTSHGRLAVFSALFVGLFVVMAAGVALAQPVDAAQPPAAVAPVLPSVQNPLPVDPFDGLAAVTMLIQAFKSAWYLGIALVLFVMVNIVRGKVKLGDWIIRIPAVSDWFDGAGSKAKAWIILGVTGLGGAFAGMAAAPTPWTASGVAMAMFSGLLGGLVLAFASMGMNDFSKTGQGSEKKIESAIEIADRKDETPDLTPEAAAALERWVNETRAKLAPKA